MLTILIESVECVNGEDFLGADEVYYMSMLGLGSGSDGTNRPQTPMPVVSRGQLVHSTRVRTLDLNDGDTGRFPPQDSVLFPNTAIPAHQEMDGSTSHVEGPIYFFDLDQKHEEHAPESQIFNAIVVGHVAGAATVVIGLMIGGAAGAIVGSLLFLGSMVAATFTVKSLLLQIDRDDYLGGYNFSVPVDGPGHEVISFDLTGSDGIEADDGKVFSGTAGTVLYKVTVHVDREETEP